MVRLKVERVEMVNKEASLEMERVKREAGVLREKQE